MQNQSKIGLRRSDKINKLTTIKLVNMVMSIVHSRSYSPNIESSIQNIGGISSMTVVIKTSHDLYIIRLYRYGKQVNFNITL